MTMFITKTSCIDCIRNFSMYSITIFSWIPLEISPRILNGNLPRIPSDNCPGCLKSFSVFLNKFSRNSLRNFSYYFRNFRLYAVIFRCPYDLGLWRTVWLDLRWLMSVVMDHIFNVGFSTNIHRCWPFCF